MSETLKLPIGPKGLPFVGSALSFAKDPLRFFVDCQQNYKGIIHQKVLGQHIFIVFESEMVEHMLVKNAKNYRKNKFLKNWDLFFGQGLLTSDGEVWRKDRKLIQPLFHREKVLAYTELMRICSRERFKAWKKGESKVINREMNALTLDIFVRAILGVELSPEKTDEVGQTFDDCMAYFHFTANPFGIILGSLPLPITKRYQKAVAKLDGIILDILKTKRPEAERNFGKTPPTDLISTLINARDESGQGLSDTQIRDQLMTFFQAGHETTALTLGYAIHLLSRHQDKQEKLRAELSQVAEIDQQTVSTLPYLKGVVQEAMRMYPSSWMLGRDAIEKDSLGGFDVPAGSTVVVPIWSFHRDPEYFPNPEAFEPERWSAEFSNKLPRTRYLPFGYGQRMCIGSMFAMFELQYVLGNLYRSHGTRLLSEPEIQVSPSVTARPKNDIVVEIV